MLLLSTCLFGAFIIGALITDHDVDDDDQGGGGMMVPINT
jgi:hypothetical protein